MSTISSAADERPVGRMWAMTGGDLGTPGVAEAFCERIIGPIQQRPGLAGVFGLVDRSRARVVGISFWEDREAMAASWSGTTATADAVFDLSTVVTEGPYGYEVVFSKFHQAPGRAWVTTIDRPVARFGVLEGGTVADPPMLDVFTAHFRQVVDLPGCVGMMLLADPENARILAVTFWVDERHLERTEALSADVVASFVDAAGARATEFGYYEVVMIEPMSRRVH